MSLEDLNRTIYGEKSGNVSGRMDIYDKYDPTNKPFEKPSPFAKDEVWKKADNEMQKGQKNKLVIIGSIIALILVSICIFAGYTIWQKNAFYQDKVIVTIEGPKDSDSTTTVQYLVKIKNNNRVTLKKPKIVLDYSENFQPIDNVNLKFISSAMSEFYLNDIGSGQEVSMPLKGIFYAPKDAPVYIHVSVHFTPSNSKAELISKNQIGVNITSAPVTVEMLGPENIVNGDSVEYIIDYKNQDNKPLQETQMRVTYPEGFEFISSEPMPSENQNIWYVGTIEAGVGGKIKIRGKISGTDGQIKVAKAVLGHTGSSGEFAIFNQREKKSKLIAPILQVAQILKGKQDTIVQMGEELNYTIRYKNTSDISMRDAIVTLSIKGAVFDFSKLKLEKGSYDSKNELITWKASDIPGLATIPPKSGGDIDFSIPVKYDIPITGPNDKNFVLSTLAKIDSPDIPTPIGANKIVGTNQFNLKVGTKVILEQLGFFNDPQLPNTGAMPMEIGKETSFTIHWTVANISNDVTGTKITSSLPSGVKWVGKTFPSDAKISYEQRTNQIIWEVGDVAAAVGILNAKKEIAFQLAVIPQENQAGQKIKLLNETILNAKDAFTGQEVIVKNPLQDTEIPEDTGSIKVFYEVKRSGA